jgi:hypothetical protein
MVGGVKNTGRAEVINADAVEVETVGDGLEGLQDTELTAEKRQDIATALGIPQSILFSTEVGGLGGGGVVEQDDMRLFRDTILPEAKFIEGIINEQVFEPLKLKFKFIPETMDIFHQDEKARSLAILNLSIAISNFFNIGLDPQVGFNALGYEISEKDQKIIAAAFDKYEPVGKTEIVQEARRTPKSTEDLHRWMRKALKKVGQAVPFESEEIELEVKDKILASLTACKSEDEVRLLFRMVMDAD